MGKVEKIVVLSVLFLITVILAVSLQAGGEEDPVGDVPGADGFSAALEGPAPQIEEGGAALSSADVRGTARANPETRERLSDLADDPLPISGADEPAPAEPAPRSLDRPAPGSSGSSGLLDSSVEVEPRRGPAPPAAEPREELLGEDWDLRSLRGLVETYDPELWIYPARAGDTLEKIATAYYGDAAKAELLRRNNEGVGRLVGSEQLLLPVRDESAFRGTVYRVVENDSLWGIAKKVYGKGSRWGEIFEENRDILPTPETFLRPGMTLRIP